MLLCLQQWLCLPRLTCRVAENRSLEGLCPGKACAHQGALRVFLLLQCFLPAAQGCPERTCCCFSSLEESQAGRRFSKSLPLLARASALEGWGCPATTSSPVIAVMLEQHGCIAYWVRAQALQDIVRLRSLMK